MYLCLVTPLLKHRRGNQIFSRYEAGFVCFWRDSPQWARASSFTRFLDHTQHRSKFGRTSLEEWSVRRRDLYLTTQQHTQLTNIHASSWIWTHDLSRWAATDLRLRPHDHWDRLTLHLHNPKIFESTITVVILYCNDNCILVKRLISSPGLWIPLWYPENQLFDVCVVVLTLLWGMESTTA